MGRPPRLAGHVAERPHDLPVFSLLHMSQRGEKELPDLGHGVPRPCFGKRSEDAIDQLRKRRRGTDMPDLAATEAIQRRIGELGREVILFACLEKIDGDEQCRPVRQQVPDQMAQPAMAPQEQMNAVIG